jgi:hypothetical protein
MGRPCPEGSLTRFTKWKCGKYFCECSLLCTSNSPAQARNPRVLDSTIILPEDFKPQYRPVLPAATPAGRVRHSQATSTFVSYPIQIARRDTFHRKLVYPNGAGSPVVLCRKACFARWASISHWAAPRPDPESLPPASFSPIRPVAVCKRNSSAFARPVDQIIRFWRRLGGSHV